jgi:hypothetical protein
MNDTATVPPPPASGQAVENDDCALVVAMSKYKELARLRGPAPDAVKFCTWLHEKGGLKLENIKLVNSDEDGQPVNREIIDALSKLGIRMKQRRGRRLYVYYAGHGLGPEFNDVAMVPADAAKDLLEETCYSLNRCMDLFVKTGFFDELVVFMDCCREREEVPTIGLPFKFEGPFKDAKPVNHFALLAAGDGAKAFEVPELSEEDERQFRGLMTTALIDGLNGAPGAIDANNNVTSTSLSHYVATRVQEQARERGLPQTIDRPKPPATEIVFYSVPEGQVPTIELPLVVGPQSAGQPIMLLNSSTGEMVTEGARQEGEIITVVLKGNARYQLIIPGRQPVVVDPALLPSQPDNVQLP